MKRTGLVLAAVVVAAALVATAVTFASSGGTTIDHDGDRVTLAAGPGQEVSGQTDLDPGTTLQLRLRSTDASQPFLLRQEATVADDGSFAATFDLGDVGEGATGNLTVRHDGTVLTYSAVEVVACDDDCDEEATGADEESDHQSSGTTVDHDGDTLMLEAGPEREISGQSDLETGTELSLTLQSTDATQPLLLRENATVGDDGSFAATMDLAFVSEETNASLTVSHDGEELAVTDVRIEPCEDDCDEQTASSDDESAVQAEFGFEEDVVAVTRDETAEIPVAVGDADAVTLRVGGEDVNYQVTATARDGNDDGRVVFAFDPSAAGNDEQTVTVRDADDTVSVGNETALDDPLSPAAYDLSLYRGASTDGDVDDIGTLSLQDS